MKVYVVLEEATVAGEEYERLMGVFSSDEKACEAAKVYEQNVKDSCWRYTYIWVEREVDEIWQEQ